MSARRWTPAEWVVPWAGSALAVGQLVLARPSFAPALVAVLLLAWVPLRRSPLASPRALPWLLALPFAAWWVLAVSSGRGDAGPVELVAIPAWFFAILSILQVLAGARSGSWRVWNALVAILLSGFAPGPAQWGLAASFCIVALLHARVAGAEGDPRRWRSSWLPALLGILLLASLPLWTPLRLPRGGFEGRRWDGLSHKGFSSSLRLGDGFGIDPAPSDDEVAVRVWSSRPPAYLKGAVFDTYVRGSWSRSEGWERPVSDRNDLEHAVFCLVSDTLDPMTGFALASVATDGLLLVPPSSGCVGVVADSIRQTGSGVRLLPGQGLDRGWKWFPGEVPARVLPAETKVPRLLEPLLDSARREAGIEDAPTDSVPVRISRWFDREFRYSLRVRPGSGEDPLRVLLEDREGYCEHFASLGALLARRSGIPARVATGFAGGEPSAGAWIYRRSSAHAWVELFDSARGWTTWDPTPAAGLATSPGRTRWSRLAEDLGTRWRFAWHLVRDGGWRLRLEDWTEASIARLRGRPVLAVVAALVAAAILSILLRRRRRSGGSGVSELARLLARAEERLRREGHVRTRGETVGQFLARLPATADAGSRRDLETYQAHRWARAGAPGASGRKRG